MSKNTKKFLDNIARRIQERSGKKQPDIVVRGPRSALPKFLATLDKSELAKEFVEMVKLNPEMPLDVVAMGYWFDAAAKT